MRLRLIAAGATVLLLAPGCGTGDEVDDRADDPATSESTVDGATAAPGDYPRLDAENYHYMLEMACFCPITMPVEVTVEDGEVTSAVAARGGHRFAQGEEVPDAGRLTINDIIDAANDTGADEVVVDWPAGQDWPDLVTVDPIEGARDDEITYRISDVELG